LDNNNTKHYKNEGKHVQIDLWLLPRYGAAYLGGGDGEARGVVRTGAGFAAQSDQLLDVAHGPQQLVPECMQRGRPHVRTHSLGRAPLTLGPLLLLLLLLCRGLKRTRGLASAGETRGGVNNHNSPIGLMLCGQDHLITKWLPLLVTSSPTHSQLLDHPAPTESHQKGELCLGSLSLHYAMLYLVYHT